MIKKVSAIFLALVMLINLSIPSISAAANDTLQSQKYNILEEKGYITRIIPETSVEEFCQNFNIESNRIHIYNGGEEVTQGNIKTGMKATFEGFDEECEYELSVIGDINCDGLTNQIDLNLLIKHVIGYLEGQIKGLQAISADLSGDNKVNQVDITVLIRYIVEGELYIPEIKRPSAPSIEIVSGRQGENDWYTSDVTVKIKENENTPVPVAKTIYKVTGDANIENEIHGQEIFDISEEGEYKITAYSYSAEGARTTIVTKTVKIDKTAPTNTAPTATKTTNKITVISNQTDAVSGIDNVKYQIKKSGETQWGELQNSNEFTGLEQNTEYNIRTYAKDKAGKGQYSQIASITTNSLPDITDETESVITINRSEENPTNEDVVITLELSEDIDPNGEYEIEYSTDGGNTWKEYDPDEGIKMSENGDIKIRLTDGTNTGEAITITVGNIDKDKPTDTAPTAEATTNKITVTNNQTDAASGIEKVQYQIKKNSETEWEELQDSNEFTGLEQNTEYDVRTYAEDKAGNKQYSEVYSITTGTIPSAEGNIILTPSKTNWTNENVVVTASGGEAISGYTIQTKLNDGSWTNTASQTATAYGDVIYARLTDGTNVGAEALITINNIDKDKPTDTVPLIAETENKITVTNKQTDALSGIESVQYQIKRNSETEWGELQDSNEFTGLEQNTKYDVRTYTEDKAGNNQYSEVFSITIGNNETSTLTVTINKDGTAYEDSGMKISVRSSLTETDDMLSETVSNGSTATLIGNGSNLLEEGTTYYIFMGKDSNHKTDMVYSGVTFTGGSTATATVNYYTLTMKTNRANASVNGTTVGNDSTVVLAGGTTTAANNYEHEISAGGSSGYSFTSWEATSGNPIIANTSTASTTLKIGEASTITANAQINNATITINKDGSAWNASGMKIDISRSSSTNTKDWSYTVNSGSTMTVSGLYNGVPMYIWAGRRTGAETTMAYTGITIGGGLNVTKTVDYYTVRRSQGTGTALTTQYSNAGGDSFTGTGCVLKGAVINVSGALYSGYHDLVLKNGDTIISAGNQTITSTALFTSSATANTYTVVYNKNADDATGTMSDSSHTYGTSKNLTENAFSRTNYRFIGWATSEDGAKVYNNEESVLNLTSENGGTVNLYAVWELEETDYRASDVEYTPADSNWDVENVQEAIDALYNMYNISNGNNEDPTNNDPIVDTPITYSVAYHANGGTGTMSNSSHTYGEAKNLTTNTFSKTNYRFIGWATSEDGAKVYNDGESVLNLTSTNNATVDLYAVWELNVTSSSASDVEYTPGNSNWNVGNVQDAITELYNMLY